MASAISSIACLGLIGRNNNPLHMSVFPSDIDTTTPPHRAPLRTALEFSLLLSSTLDVFEQRARHNAATGVGLSGDVGLLHALDDRLAAYGFETNTGVRLVCVVDLHGRRGEGAGGLRDAEVRPVFRAMQSAYVRLLQNPFFEPDEHAPRGGKGGRAIVNRRFEREMRRIGESWVPGMTSV